MFQLPKSNHELSAAVKLLINIGACLDIPTGTYILGLHGESILHGGLGFLTGMTGKGNTFKSTICDYMTLSAADRIHSAVNTTAIHTYDTEVNIHESRKQAFSLKFDSYKQGNIFSDGLWEITDESIILGDVWWENEKKYLSDKKALGAKIRVSTPFKDRNGQAMTVILPTFGQLDSLSKFTTSDVAKMVDDNELGASGGNTVHMRQGLAKMRLLQELPRVCAGYSHFTTVTAHIGKDIPMATGKYAPPPEKKLNHLTPGEKIKGVTDQFYYLTSAFWYAVKSAPLVTKDRTPQFPRNSEETTQVGDTDLNEVVLKSLRCKNGPSGNTVTLLVSQVEGVLASLSEFYLLNTTKESSTHPGFGLNGSTQNYMLDIYPAVKLSRTTVRNKIDTDDKLRRALNITAELCQMYEYYRTLRSTLPAPKQLYDTLKDLGYDWDFILSSTRGWWTVNDEHHPLKFLSTMDLVKMASGEYIPFWMKEPPAKAIELYNSKNAKPWA